MANGYRFGRRLGFAGYGYSLGDTVYYGYGLGLRFGYSLGLRFTVVTVYYGYSLGVEASLKLADAFLKDKRTYKYFGTLAKITNLWRDSRQRILKAWVRQHGHQSAVKHALRVPPRCLAGRWGSISATENRILDAGGATTIVPVFEEVLFTGKRPERLHHPGQEIDDPRVDQIEHFRAIRSRWVRESKEAMDDWLLWSMIEIGNRARQILIHLLLLLQRPRSDGPTILVDLALGKSDKLMKEAEDGLDDAAWLLVIDPGRTQLSQESISQQPQT